MVKKNQPKKVQPFEESVSEGMKKDMPFRTSLSRFRWQKLSWKYGWKVYQIKDKTMKLLKMMKMLKRVSQN